MVGDYNNLETNGIIPRTFDYIFNKINSMNNSQNNDEKFNIYLSFVQIYLESIQDLLDPKYKTIKIRESSNGNIFLEGIQWYKVENKEECSKLFHSGEKYRITECTKLNEHSSRSHAILILRIEHSTKVENSEKINIKNLENQTTNRIIKCANLYLVDLAGSERIKKSRASEIRLEEAKKINLSLLALGNVISSLADPKINYHVCYRDSKLTRLLQESIGGNANTSLIVTVSPSSYNRDETLSSLFFGSRAMKVQNKPIMNKFVDFQSLCIKLQEELDKANDDYAKLKLEYDLNLEELENLKNEKINFNIDKNHFIDDSSIGSSIIIKTDNFSSNENDNNYKKKLNKLSKFYENILTTKSEEFEKMLVNLDDKIYEKDNQIDRLTKQINNLNKTIKNQKLDIEDMIKEKEDLQKSVVDLTSQNQQLKNILNANDVGKEYKLLIDQLYETISNLENRILKMEESSIMNENSKAKLSSCLEDKINVLQTEINNIINEKLKKNQNLEIDSDENNILKNDIGTIEKQISYIKESQENINDIITTYQGQNKVDLIILLTLMKIDNFILKDKLLHLFNTQKINENKNENKNDNPNIQKMESIKDPSNNKYKNQLLVLNKNYEKYIDKLVEVNTDIGNIVNLENNKLFIDGSNIEKIINETENLNNNLNINITNLSKDDFNKIKEDNKLSFDELISKNFENYITLLKLYNCINFNVCQILYAMKDFVLDKKRFYDEIIKYIQNNLKESEDIKKLIEKIKTISIKEDNNFFVDLGELFKDFLDIYENICNKSRMDNVTLDNIEQNKNNEKEEDIEAMKMTIDKKDKIISEAKIKIEELKNKINSLSNMFE